jgi:hypothetical protein
MSVFAGEDTVCNISMSDEQPSKLVRTCTMEPQFQIGQTCVPTSVGNVIMHNICKELGYTGPNSVCLSLNQLVFDMIIKNNPSCVKSGVSTEETISNVVRTFNNFFKSYRDTVLGRECKKQKSTTINAQGFAKLGSSDVDCKVVDLLEEIQSLISGIELHIFNLKYTNYQPSPYTISKIQSLCQRDLYGVIKVRGYEYNQTFKDLISANLQNFFPDPSFAVFKGNDPIIVFQNEQLDGNQDIINNFMTDYLIKVADPFREIYNETKQNTGSTTWGHTMVLKAVFTYDNVVYALIKNSFGPEYGLYDEGIKVLNGHIILPLDMLPEYAIYVPVPVTRDDSGKKRKLGGKKTRRRSRKTMRKRRPNKKTRANRKKGTCK